MVQKSKSTIKSSDKVSPEKNIAPEMEKLKKENAILKQLLSETATKPKGKFKSFMKSLAVFLLILVSVITLFLLNISFWFKQNVVDTNTFVATTQPLIQNKDIQTALANNLTTELFKNINVEQELKANLPENIQFLAGPLSKQIEGFTNGQINKIIASEQAYTVWTNLLTKTHSTVIGYISNQQNDGVITVNDLYTYAGQQLGSSPVSFLFNKQLPAKFGNIELKEISWLPQARTYLNAIEKLPIVLSIVFIISVGLALLLSSKKRKILFVTASLSAITMALTLVIIRLGLWDIAKQVKPQNKDAVQAAYRIISTGLNSQTLGMLWLFIASIIGLLILSPYAWVKYCVTKLRMGIDFVFSKTLPDFKSPQWLTSFSAYHFAVACTLSAVWFAIFALRLPPTKNGVINAMLATVISLFVLEIITSISRVRK